MAGNKSSSASLNNIFAGIPITNLGIINDTTLYIGIIDDLEDEEWDKLIQNIKKEFKEIPHILSPDGYGVFHHSSIIP